MIGWAAVTGDVSLASISLFAAHLHVDAAAFLGAGAVPRRRLRPGRRADAAGGGGRARDQAPDAGLHAAAAAGRAGAGVRSASPAGSMARSRSRSALLFLVSRGRGAARATKAIARAKAMFGFSILYLLRCFRRCWSLDRAPGLAGVARPMTPCSKCATAAAVTTSAPPAARAQLGHVPGARRVRGAVLRRHHRRSCGDRLMRHRLRGSGRNLDVLMVAGRRCLRHGRPGLRLGAALRPVLPGHRLRRHAAARRPPRRRRSPTAVIQVRFNADVDRRPALALPAGAARDRS